MMIFDRIYNRVMINIGSKGGTNCIAYLCMQDYMEYISAIKKDEDHYKYAYGISLPRYEIMYILQKPILVKPNFEDVSYLGHPGSTKALII